MDYCSQTADAAAVLGIPAESVLRLPPSDVIGKQLPMDKIKAASRPWRLYWTAGRTAGRGTQSHYDHDTKNKEVAVQFELGGLP